MSGDKKPLEEAVQNPIKKNQWRPGQSGNPQGRPKGSKNKTTLIKRAIEADVVGEISDDVKAVARKAIEMAMDGDTAMIKLVWDTFMSKAKIEDKTEGKGSGGINIVIKGLEKPAIDAEIIEEDKDERDR